MYLTVFFPQFIFLLISRSKYSGKLTVFWSFYSVSTWSYVEAAYYTQSVECYVKVDKGMFNYCS